MKYFAFIIFISSIIFFNFKVLLNKESNENKEIFPNDENFDVFKYAKGIKNETLLLYKLTDFVLNDLIGKNAKNQIISKNKLYEFLLVIAKEYNSNTLDGMNPYHNLYHAAEVTQNLYIYLSKSKKNNNPFIFSDTYVKQDEELEFKSNINYNDLDIFALIISAVCHDFRHTGRDNGFYSTYKNKVPFAKILKEYDYKLEYYHYEEAKKLMEEMDVLELLNKYQKDRFYKIMKLAIYGTDNSLNNKHAEDLVTYKEIIKINSINLAKEKIKENINLNINSSMKDNYINEAIDDIKLLIFECFVHGADISGSTKAFDYLVIWADKVLIEFCEQSKEVHSLDASKDINCVGNDEKKFRESELSFFANIVDIFFKPFCEVFDYLNYLCINDEKNKKILEGDEKIHS